MRVRLCVDRREKEGRVKRNGNRELRDFQDEDVTFVASSDLNPKKTLGKSRRYAFTLFLDIKRMKYPRRSNFVIPSIFAQY